MPKGVWETSEVSLVAFKDDIHNQVFAWSKMLFIESFVLEDDAD